MTRSATAYAALAVAMLVTLRAQVPDAAQVLGAARDAMGGEKKLSAVRTFIATGRTRQLRGNNLVPIEFEINCELPDKCVRTDEFPAQDAAPATQGVMKQDFASLTLGMFAASFSSYPLTFKYAAVGEAPEGKADVLDVTGPANFAARLVVQQTTHLPVMLMWQQPPPNPQGKPSEIRIYYADYRDVDGMKFPFRLRRAVNGDTVEETTFDRFRINAKIDPRKFEARK